MRYLSEKGKRLVAFFCMVLCFTAVLTACRSSLPVAFYTLNAQGSAFESQKDQPAGLSGEFSIGIRYIRLPDYLDRPQIVTLNGTHTVHLSEFHRWAAPLKQEIGQVVAENFIVLLQTPKIVFFPWDTSERPRHRVDLTFYHFEGALGKSFHAQGVWQLVGPRGESATVYRTFDFQIPISGSNYEDLAEAYSKSLWLLSSEISSVVKKQP